MSLYWFGQTLVRIVRPAVAKLEVTGLENIPAEGAFLLVANHQSYLDPVLIQATVRRPIHTMAKSTQFSDPLTGRILRKIKVFPVRRFEPDPQAVRIALRRLAEGEGVGIYVEGERTWDGRLQPPRLGALRLILKAGAPVVPCGVSGTYDMWPRWDRALERGRARLAFGPPMRFPQIDGKAERDAALPQTADRLMGALAELAGVERGTVG